MSGSDFLIVAAELIVISFGGKKFEFSVLQQRSGRLAKNFALISLRLIEALLINCFFLVEKILDN